MMSSVLKEIHKILIRMNLSKMEDYLIILI